MFPKDKTRNQKQEKITQLATERIIQYGIHKETYRVNACTVIFNYGLFAVKPILKVVQSGGRMRNR